jgi:hypothetical protein
MLFVNEDEGFHVSVAHSVEEACKLIEAGFEYVTDMDGAKLFRKKRESFIAETSLLLLQEGS